MLSIKSILILLLASLTCATPALEERTECLTYKQASFLTNIMVSISVKFDPNYVSKYIADDFIVQSDSINFLTGGKAGQITANKTLFIESSYNLTQSSPQPQINVLNMFHSCHGIAFHWISLSKPIPVRGIDMVYVKPGTMKIEKDFSEFNDAVDLVNAGLFPCPTLTSSTSTATPKPRQAA